MHNNKLMELKNWLHTLFTQKAINSKYNEEEMRGYLNIPIRSLEEKKYKIPIHTHLTDYPKKISHQILNALGGSQNIESYREIPNSQRIRLTLINPDLIDNELLEEIEIRMFIRIGKRIIHIIP